MFDKFTKQARRVVVLAEERARGLNHPLVGTEHLLLGLVGEDSIAVQVLLSMGVTAQAVADTVYRATAPGSHLVPGRIPFTPRSKRVLLLATDEAKQMGHKYIGSEHVLLGILREPDGLGGKILLSFGIDLPRARDQVAGVLWQLSQSGLGIPGVRVRPPALVLPPPTGDPLPAPAPASVYSDLIAAARYVPAPPLIGREEVLAQLAEILSSPDRNSALLIGERGVGKTAMVNALARMVVDGTAPNTLRGAAMLGIDQAALSTADAQHLHDRVETLRLGRFPGGPVICVVEDAAALDIEPGEPAAPAEPAAPDKAAAIATVLSGLRTNQSPLIVTATPAGANRLAAARPGVLDLFDVVTVPTPSPSEALPMVAAARAALQAQHGIGITDDAVHASVALVAEYRMPGNLPGAAINLLGDACVQVKGSAAILDAHLVRLVAAGAQPRVENPA